MRRAAALISVVLWLHPAVTFAAPDPAELEARRLFAEGERQFKLGAFDVALASFTAAYEKRPLPGFLFNLGQCHRMLEHHERALFFFEGYLRDKPDAKNRAVVEGLIAEERAALAAQRAEAARREEERTREEERARAEALRLAEEARLAADAARIAAIPPPAPALWERPWFWVVVGAVVVGAGGTAVALSGDDPATPAPREVPPAGSAGTLDWRVVR